MDNSTLIAILTCSGLWAVINTITAYLISKKQKAEDKARITKDEFEAVVKGVRGLLYGELEQRCTEYINQGTITAAELNDLRKYYYEPYVALKGDGTIEALFKRVESLNLGK